MNDIGRRERKRQRTMDHLADTAWELFEAQGFETVTMEAIAETADVAKGTLYKYFPVKEALLRHRFHSQMAQNVPALLEEMAALPTVADQLRLFLDRNAEWAEVHRDYLPPYLRLRMGEVTVPYDVDAPGRSGLEAILSGLISSAQESGEFRKDVDTAATTHYLEFLYLAAFMRWLNGAEPDLRREFRSILELFLRGMAP
jgi:AcrR family transcriptional regulator